MKTLLCLVLVFIYIVSCGNDDNSIINTCSVANPLEELEWLKKIIEDIEQSTLVDDVFISQANYKGETVFIIGNCCDLCNSVIPVYNCTGDLINILGCSNEQINFNILNRDTVIWNSENFLCQESNNLSCN